MENRELALALARSESEHEVIELLTDAGYWNDPLAWREFGGSENNFATIGNQQSRPEVALVEKLINSVDAVLMAECIGRGMDLDGPGSPQSIKQAVQEFFGVEDGKLSNVPPSLRSNLAARICLVASGTKSNPCYTIVDSGEGQTPRSMPDTLLSIGKSNKLRIPFVQGKFNMGGTGVFQFCGTSNLQLIISKRHPQVAVTDRDSTKRYWGFSVVRRENPSKGIRSSIYRYLAPDKEILSFDADELPLLPGEYPNPTMSPMEYGTYIKLFEYQMTGLKTNVLFDLYNRLSLLMAEVALPIRLYERRPGFSGHSMETTLAGLTVRLDDDSRGNLEAGFPTSAVIHVNDQEMRASVFAFARGQAEKYRKDEGVIFLVNGQTHGHLSTTFFSRKSVGMGYLADSILVMVDCTNIEGRAREDLFMNSRDRLRSGDFRSAIERELESLIREHPGLRELRERRRREELLSRSEQSEPLEEIVESVLKRLPSLARILQPGVRISNPFASDVLPQPSKFDPKRFPTFFRPTVEFPVERPKRCPINNERFRVSFDTDAENEYFSRSDHPGEFHVFLDNHEITDFAIHLWNGAATLNVSLPEDASTGGLLEYKTTIGDPTRIEPFEHHFFILLDPPSLHPAGTTGGRRTPPSQGPGKNGNKRQGLDIPRPHFVYKSEWAKHDFNEHSALRVVDSGEGGWDFFVNVDNIYLLAEKKSQTKIDPRTLEMRFAAGMVIIGLAVLRDNDDREGVERSGEDDSPTDKIAQFSRIMAPFLIPMLQLLNNMSTEEIGAAYETD